jgi:hypothetical protein
VKIVLTASGREREREREPAIECNLMCVVSSVINLFDVLYVIITSHHVFFYATCFDIRREKNDCEIRVQ